MAAPTAPTATVMATRHLTGRDRDQMVRTQALRLFMLGFYHAFFYPGGGEFLDIGRSLFPAHVVFVQ